LEDKREEDGGEEPQVYFSSADLIKVYVNELKGGKFWGVSHDLVSIFEKFDKINELDVLGVLPRWYLMGEPCPDVTDSTQIFSAAFDNVFFTTDSLEIVAVEDINDACQPFPNENEPSDHKMLRCVFKFK